jgi:CRISPR-associated protein (TIGR03986 family)
VFPYKDYKELPGHDVLDPSYLNGYIEYKIENETPIIVGKNTGKEEECITPFKNPNGQYAIPGNTIRGILRNNVGFLSLSSLEDFIEDSRFYFRSFGNGKDRVDYKKRLSIGTKNVGQEIVLMPRNINGGYIYKDSNYKYVIEPSRKVGNNDLSYFVIKEQYLRYMHPRVQGINYMYNDKILDLIMNKDKYKSKGHNMSKNKRDLLRKNINTKYNPYCIKISFEIKNVRTISKIGKPGEYNYNGYLMSSERISGKQVHYIIPEPDFENPNKEVISIENGKLRFIDFYNDDLLRTKKRREPNKIDKDRDKPYFFLPDKEGKENGKPIFYGKFNGKIYFGFSPYLRIPYDYSIKDLIPEGYKDKSGFSYVDALFGFTEKGKDKLSYKGRISVEDAVCIDSSPKLDKEYKLIVGEPHATSYQLYLKQDMKYTPNEIKNYNDSDSEIRGIKEYLNKDYCDSVENAKGNVSVSIRPLAKNTRFKGRIYFKNLKREELGLILWALKVRDDAFETVGYGKPYGFGRVKLKNISVKTEDVYKKYSSMTANYYNEEDRNELINEYKKSFKDRFNIDIDNQLSVKEFIILKTLVFDREHENEARYMKIEFYKDNKKDNKKNKDNDNEFSMLKPLPDPIELKKIVDGKYIPYKNTSPKVYKKKKGTNNRTNRGKSKHTYNKNKVNSSGNLNNSIYEQLKEWNDKNNNS